MVESNDRSLDLLEWLSSDQEVRGFVQLALLGSTTRQVIHETNNQLTGILGYLTLAQKTPNLPNSLASYIQRTVQCCESIQFINNTFLDFFQTAERGNLTHFESLSQVVSFCQKIFGLDCRIRVKGIESLSSTDESESPFGILFLYLLMAARNDIRGHGEIHLKMALEQASSTDSSSRMIVDIHPRRSVLKESPSIDLWDSPSLSLIQEMCVVLAQEYALQLGGEFFCENHSVKPATYRICLPIKQTTRESSPIRVPDSCPPAGFPSAGLPSAYRIVLLEDQPIITDFIRSLLSREGHWVQGYANGNDLINALLTLDLVHMDLFLLDICVPGIDGIAVGTAIRKINPEAKIVFYSALRNEEAVLKHFALDGKTKFLQKPFRKEELFEMIQSAMLAKKE